MIRSHSDARRGALRACVMSLHSRCDGVEGSAGVFSLFILDATMRHVGASAGAISLFHSPCDEARREALCAREASVNSFSIMAPSRGPLRARPVSFFSIIATL